MYSLNTMEVYLIDDVCIINGKPSLQLRMDRAKPLRFIESIDVHIICRSQRAWSPGGEWDNPFSCSLVVHVTCLACLIHTRTLSIGAGIKPLRALRLHFSLINRGTIYKSPLEDYQRPLLQAFGKLRGIKEVEITGLEDDADWVEGIRRQIMGDVEPVSLKDFPPVQRWDRS
jgi:hypothetical protein